MEPIDRLIGQLGRWSAGRGPLYLLLADRLGRLIDSGQLPPGTALPPDRTLAEHLAVGRGTVVNAYERLRQERKVERHQGRGTRVAPAVPVLPGAVPAINPLFVNYLEPLDGVLPLACTAPHGPPPELVTAYERALSRLPGADSGDIGYYPLGHVALREALACHYTEAGVPTTAEQILVTTGGQQALALLARLFVGPGDTVAVQTPTYPGALEVFRDAAAAVTPFDAPGGARLAYVNPTNHNPTGATMSTLVRRRLVETAVARGIQLIDDEVQAGLSFDADPPPGLAAFAPDVLTVGSLSKVVWGGLRVGWIRAGETDIARLARVKVIHDLGSAALEQLAAAELVPRLGELGRRRAEVLRQRHDHLCAALRSALPQWTFDEVGGGQCLWVRLPGCDASSFAQLALRHGVSVLPGGALDPSGGSEDRLRLPFTAPPEELTECVRRLTEAWTAWRQLGGNGGARVQALVV